MVDILEDIVDMVVHCSHSVEAFFYNGRGEFVVIVQVCSACIKAMETSAWGEFVGCSGCGSVGKFCER